MRYADYDLNTLSGRIKYAMWEQDKTYKHISHVAGLAPGSLRARLTLTYKRSLQPWQVERLAKELNLDVQLLHTLAARQEGWKVVHPSLPPP